MRGDSHRAFAFAVTDDPIIESVPFDENLELEECCYDLPLLVESGNPAVQDPLKNDKTSYFEFYGKSINAVVLILVKCVNGAAVDQVTISDSTYGEFKDFGTETHDGLDYISIKDINWTLIFDTFGAGEYQFRTDQTSIFSSTPLVSRFDFVYHLKEFTDSRANTTVFMRVFNSGNMGDHRNNGKTKFTYPDNWEDGKRIDAIFWADKDEMEESYTTFNDGFEEYTGKKLKVTYTLATDTFPQRLREYIQFVVRMANSVEMTNYQNNNPTKHVNLPVQATGGYEPNYIKQFSKAGFSIEFKQAFDNYEKLHC